MNSSISLIILVAIIVIVFIVARNVKKKIKADRMLSTPSCANCEFYTPYQMINNRDVRVDVHHCSILSMRIKAINGNYMTDMSTSINNPESFACNQHKFK